MDPSLSAAIELRANRAVKMLSSTQSGTISFIEPPAVFCNQWRIHCFRLFERLLCFSEKRCFIKNIWIAHNFPFFFFPAFRYFHSIPRLPITTCLWSELASVHACRMYGLHIPRSKRLNTGYSLRKLHFEQCFGSFFLHLFFEREFLWDKVNAFADKVGSLMWIS